MADGPVERVAGDAGMSLVEILVAIMLVGIAFVALLSGLSTVAIGSNLHHKQADAEVVLTSAAEHLRSPSVAHAPCATPATYESALRTQLANDLAAVGWASSTVRIVDIDYWDGTTFVEDVASCPDTDALGHLLNLQLVTITVDAPNGPTETIDVIKDDLT